LLGPNRLDFPRGERYNPAGSRTGRATRRSARSEERELGLHTYELIMQGEFAAAHRLREYDGNCERLHGHNWKVDVVLRGENLDKLGMVLDFRDAKRLLNQVLDELDHSYLNELEAFRQQNPTTENVARVVYDALAARLPDGVTVARVTAWECDHCGASYSQTP